MQKINTKLRNLTPDQLESFVRAYMFVLKIYAWVFAEKDRCKSENREYDSVGALTRRFRREVRPTLDPKEYEGTPSDMIDQTVWAATGAHYLTQMAQATVIPSIRFRSREGSIHVLGDWLKLPCVGAVAFSTEDRIDQVAGGTLGIHYAEVRRSGDGWECVLHVGPPQKRKRRNRPHDTMADISAIVDQMGPADHDGLISWWEKQDRNLDLCRKSRQGDNKAVESLATRFLDWYESNTLETREAVENTDQSPATRRALQDSRKINVH